MIGRANGEPRYLHMGIADKLGGPAGRSCITRR